MTVQGVLRAACALALAGIAVQTSAQTPAQSPAQVPASVAVPAGQQLLLQATATGV